MATRLQDELRRLADIHCEAQVGTVIALYDACVIPSIAIGMIARYEELRNILTFPECGLKLSEEEADYWLEFFGIKPSKETDE